MKVAYVISGYTNENSNFKRHIIGNEGKPICMSHTRSFSLEYTDEQSNCKRCLNKELKALVKRSVLTKKEEIMPQQNINFIEWDAKNRQYLIRLAGTEKSQEDRLAKMTVAEELYEALKSLSLGDIDPVYRQIIVKILAKADGK